MNPKAEFDIVVYGASGYTGQLVAEHLAQRNAAGAGIKWAMAGRGAAKLATVRDEIGAPKDTPLVVADAADPASVRAMAGRAKAVITTVGPYQLYGSDLVAACAETGADYLDLCGETVWMRRMIDAHDAQAKTTGSRIVFSCGFDSLPFELGVWFCQGAAVKAFGKPAPLVKGRVRLFRGGVSGGSLASGAVTMEAIQQDPSMVARLADPYLLTPGFEGPPQPAMTEPQDDPDVGPVSPWMLATINAKNVLRSNQLMDFAYGRDFVYDEMMVGGPFESGFDGPQLKPGEGPSKEVRDTGGFDVLFIGVAPDGRQVRVSVKGDRDPGYGSTSKMIAETAVSLIGAPDVAGGVWTPAAALQGRLVEQMKAHAGFTFTVES